MRSILGVVLCVCVCVYYTVYRAFYVCLYVYVCMPQTGPPTHAYVCIVRMHSIFGPPMCVCVYYIVIFGCVCVCVCKYIVPSVCVIYIYIRRCGKKLTRDPPAINSFKINRGSSPCVHAPRKSTRLGCLRCDTVEISLTMSWYCVCVCACVCACVVTMSGSRSR